MRHRLHSRRTCHTQMESFGSSLSCYSCLGRDRHHCQHQWRLLSSYFSDFVLLLFLLVCWRWCLPLRNNAKTVIEWMSRSDIMRFMILRIAFPHVYTFLLGQIKNDYIWLLLVRHVKWFASARSLIISTQSSCNNYFAWQQVWKRRKYRFEQLCWILFIYYLI